MPEEKQTTISRRAFVGSAAALTALNSDSPVESTDKIPTARRRNITRLAGLTLTELRQRYHDELFNVVIPFWDKHGVDHERGGFMCALDHDGTPVNTDKFLWFQGRGIRVYSHLYRHFHQAARRGHANDHRPQHRGALDGDGGIAAA